MNSPMQYLNRMNPFYNLWMGLRSLQRQFGNMFRLPAPLRSIGSQFSQIFMRFKPFKDWADQRKEKEFEKEFVAIQGKPFYPTRRNTQYSQIHLINRATRERSIVHIGSNIGRSQVDLSLDEKTRLYFLRVNPEKYNAPLLIEANSGVEIEVDGQPLVDALPVRAGSHIKIQGASYRVELYAWDELPEVTRVYSAWMTTNGPTRDHNEDAIGIYQHPTGYFFGVADGVGGGAAGEIMSEFAMRYMLATFNANVKYGFDWQDVLTQAGEHINAAIYKQSHGQDNTTGTTMTALVIQNWDAHILHIGDTRLYHLGKNGFHRITRDHIGYVEQEGMNPGEIVVRPVLTRALGKAETAKTDVMMLRLNPGDRLLMVSDGMETAPEDKILAIMRRPSLEDAPQDLVNLAIENRTTDNISAIVIEVLPEGQKQDTWKATASARVYTGFDGKSRLQPDPLQDFQTTHPSTTGGIGCWIVLLLLICGIFFGVQAYQQSTIVETVTPTPTQLVIITPSATAIAPTPTASLTPTPIATLEPTSTQRPVPTSTLARPLGGMIPPISINFFQMLVTLP